MIRRSLGVSFVVLLVLIRICTAGGSEFNGSTSKIEIAHQSAISTTSFTVGCWARWESLGESNVGRLMEKDTAWALRLQGTAPDRWRFAGFGWSTDGIWTSPVQTVNTWARVVVSYDTSNVSNVPALYLDGVAQSVSTVTAPVGTWTAGTGGLLIGNSTASSVTWDGQIADCFYVDRLLTPGEVLQDYTEGPLSLGPALVGFWGLGELGSFNRTSTAGLDGTDTAISVSTVTGPPRRYLSLSSGEWP